MSGKNISLMFDGRDVVFGVLARQEVKIVISKISKISRRRTDVGLSSGGDALSHHLLHVYLQYPSTSQTSYYVFTCDMRI